MPTDELFFAAHAAWEDGDLAKAAALFREAAELGDTSSMHNLGFLHDTGVGMEVDKAEAMTWYLRAHELGDTAVANNIAILHREQNDPLGALAWFEKAAAQGDGGAYVELARIYLDGLGVTASEVRACQYLQLALGVPGDSGEEDEEPNPVQVLLCEDDREEAIEMMARLRRPPR